MVDGKRPSLRFRIGLRDDGADVSLTAHVPHGASGPINTRTNLALFAAAMARFKLEAARQPELSTISCECSHFGAEKEELFSKVWNFLKNAKRSMPVNRAGDHLVHVGGLAAVEQQGIKKIEVDARVLPDGNVTFGVVTRTGGLYEVESETHLLQLIEFLVGRCPASDFMASISAGSASSGFGSLCPFLFGRRSTMTTVVQRFPDGLAPECIRCSLVDQPFSVPAKIEALVDDAHRVLNVDASGIMQVPDHQMLAPVRMAVSVPDLDGASRHVHVSLAESSYRYYTAFAFAEALATRDQRFAPLADFARTVQDPCQPSGASCSLGVRVMLQTADDKLIVAHRSKQVKLNPDVWSVSANEGVRKQLLRLGHDSADVLVTAARQAVKNELRVEAERCREPMLLSIYRNSFNQWGAGFWMQTELAVADIIRRQPNAAHSFEHRKLAALPVEIEPCGTAMRALGVRWYGGALQTLCDVLVFHELGEGRAVTPNEVAAALSRAAGDSIVPVDEPNGALLPGSATAASRR